MRGTYSQLGGRSTLKQSPHYKIMSQPSNESEDSSKLESQFQTLKLTVPSTNPALEIFPRYSIPPCGLVDNLVKITRIADPLTWRGINFRNRISWPHIDFCSAVFRWDQTGSEISHECVNNDAVYSDRVELNFSKIKSQQMLLNLKQYI